MSDEERFAFDIVIKEKKIKDIIKFGPNHTHDICVGIS